MQEPRFARRQFMSAAGAGLGLAGLLQSSPSGSDETSRTSGIPVYNVRDYRAIGDGIIKDTAAIQAAIDACTTTGGVVYFPQGRYRSGTIILKDNVTLYFSPDAVLLGSGSAGDYLAKPFPARDLDVGGFDIWALIYAEGARNISIEGRGTINADGAPFPQAKHTPDVAGSVRPRAIFLKGCTQVTLREITVRESAMWSVHLALCDKVVLQGISVYSDLFVNQDGIVLDSCRDTMISDCYVNSWDDALVIKASFPQTCKNMTITNCVLTTRCAGIKFGTQSLGGFQNVSISNCAFYDCQLGGLKFQTVDGGDLEDVTVSNLVMTNVSAPVWFRLGNRGQDFGFTEVERPRPVGRLRNVLVSNIRATVAGREGWRPDRLERLPGGVVMGIAGLPGHPVEDVTLENIHVTYPGGGTAVDARRTDIPERPDAYPENTMFGRLPVYGLYVRHARGVTLRNLRLQLAAPDLRPALLCDDVQDLDLSGLRASATNGEPLIRLRQSRGAVIRDCRPFGELDSFLRVEGDACEDIAILTNDLRKVRTAVIKSEGFTGVVTETGNLMPQ